MTAAAVRSSRSSRLRGAAFGYADNAVVRHVTLDVFPGEVVAILGPNGAGKSTIVKGLLGLSDQLGGEVLLFGTPLDRFGRTGDHARLGYVPQRHTLSGSVRATAEEIVATGTAGAPVLVRAAVGHRPPGHRPRARHRRPRRPRRDRCQHPLGRTAAPGAHRPRARRPARRPAHGRADRRGRHRQPARPRRGARPAGRARRDDAGRHPRDGCVRRGRDPRRGRRQRAASSSTGHATCSSRERPRSCTSTTTTITTTSCTTRDRR